MNDESDCHVTLQEPTKADVKQILAQVEGLKQVTIAFETLKAPNPGSIYPAASLSPPSESSTATPEKSTPKLPAICIYDTPDPDEIPTIKLPDSKPADGNGITPAKKVETRQSTGKAFTIDKPIKRRPRNGNSKNAYHLPHPESKQYAQLWIVANHYPNGITSMELAELVDRPQRQASATLSRAKNTWKWLRAEEFRAESGHMVSRYIPRRELKKELRGKPKPKRLAEIDLSDESKALEGEP